MMSEKKVRFAVQILGPGSQKEVELTLDRMEAKERQRNIDALKQNKELRKRVGHFKDALVKLRGAFRELPDWLRLPLLSASSPFFCENKITFERLALKSDWKTIENWISEDSSRDKPPIATACYAARHRCPHRYL